MNDKQLYMYLGETINYTNPDAFASDVTIALLDPDDANQEISKEIFDGLVILWHIACDPFKTYLSLLGLTQSECARRFCIPLRTVQNWAGGERSCPLYLRLMMAEIMGIWDRGIMI